MKPQHPVNERFHDPDHLTTGELAAEFMAGRIGSWGFIIGQSVVLACWVALNVVAMVRHWDPYPFILLNLMLNFQAAYTGPILLIATNRQAAKDRALADHTYQDTELLKAAVRLIHKGLRQNTELTKDVHRLASDLHEHIIKEASDGLH